MSGGENKSDSVQLNWIFWFVVQNGCDGEKPVSGDLDTIHGIDGPKQIVCFEDGI